MPVKTKKDKFTIQNRVVFDPITKSFAQKDHIVRGKKVLSYPPAKCAYKPCSKTFPKKRKDQKFCSDICRMKYWIRKQHNGIEPDYGEATCPIDGIVFQKTRPWSKYCCPDCTAEGRRRKLAQARLATI